MNNIIMMVFLLNILWSSELKNWNDISYHKKLCVVGSSHILQISFQSIYDKWYNLQNFFGWLLSLSGVSQNTGLKKASLSQKSHFCQLLILVNYVYVKRQCQKYIIENIYWARQDYFSLMLVLYSPLFEWNSD